MTPPPEPRTAAGRRWLDDPFGEWNGREPLRQTILAIEAEAAGAPLREALHDVEWWTRQLGYRNGSDRGMAKFVVETITAATPAPAPLDVTADTLNDILIELDPTFDLPFHAALAEAIAAALNARAAAANVSTRPPYSGVIQPLDQRGRAGPAQPTAADADQPDVDVKRLAQAIDEFITSQTGFDVDDAEAIAAIYTRLTVRAAATEDTDAL